MKIPNKFFFSYIMNANTKYYRNDKKSIHMITKDP